MISDGPVYPKTSTIFFGSPMMIAKIHHKKNTRCTYRRPFMEWHLLYYLSPFTSAFCQIAKLTLPFFYLVILPIFAFTNLPSPHCPIVKSTLPCLHFEVVDSTSARQHCQSGKSALPCLHFEVVKSTSARQHCQSGKSTSPCELPG